MVFLGMQRKPKSEDEKREDPIKKAEKVRESRKRLQVEHWEKYLKDKDEMFKVIKESEGDEIADGMMGRMRKWINWYRSKTGKLPDKLESYYEEYVKMMEGGGLDSDEDGDKPDEEPEKGKKAKKEKPKEKKKGKKGKKGAGGASADPKQLPKCGPTEVVKKFDNFYE